MKKLLFGALLALSARAQNLIVNPSFEDANKAFASEYRESGNLLEEGTYGITGNPQLLHPQFLPIPSHSGRKMLVANGATKREAVVWEQIIKIEPNTRYFFRAWAVNVARRSPSKWALVINGTIVNPDSEPPPLGVWKEYTGPWDSGGNTIAKIQIIFMSTQYLGNDTAFDDLEFSKVGSTATSTAPELEKPSPAPPRRPNP